MKKERWGGYEKTFEFVKARRGCVCPNSGFVEQLRKYEEALTK